VIRVSIESIGGVSGLSGLTGTQATGFGAELGDMDEAQMTRGIDGGSTTSFATAGTAALQGPSGVTGTAGVGDSSGTDFASLLSGGLDKLQGLQSTSDDLALKAATGNLTNVHDYMIASNEAQLATQLTVAVRNKAVEAFNEIMRMQI